MIVAIAGGTGFVGQALAEKLAEKGHEVRVLTRRKKAPETGVKWVCWLEEGCHPELELEGIDALVNLAGESINSGRWNPERKERILSSRLIATRECLRIMECLKQKPSVFINASAVEAERSTDDSRPVLHFKGMDFLAAVTHRWEKEAARAQHFYTRTVFARFGVILGKKEGALPRMALPCRLFAGGRVGSGQQWVSWIHIDDAVGLLLFALENPALKGPLSLTAPHPATMDEMGQTISRTLHRPHWLSAPAFALKLALGEMALLVLDGSKVMPEKAIKLGYSFQFPLLKDALEDLL